MRSDISFCLTKLKVEKNIKIAMMKASTRKISAFLKMVGYY